jgi:hypothetical protein
MITVKCLDKDQMLYIWFNHKGKTAKEMADKLRVDKLKVTLFCQANNIEPKQDRKPFKKPRQDTYHIPFMPFNYKLHRI